MASARRSSGRSLGCMPNDRILVPVAYPRRSVPYEKGNESSAVDFGASGDAVLAYAVRSLVSATIRPATRHQEHFRCSGMDRPSVVGGALLLTEGNVLRSRAEGTRRNIDDDTRLWSTIVYR